MFAAVNRYAAFKADAHAAKGTSRLTLQRSPCAGNARIEEGCGKAYSSRGANDGAIDPDQHFSRHRSVPMARGSRGIVRANVDRGC